MIIEMSFGDLSSDVVEHSILPFVPLTDLCTFDECCWGDDVEFLKKLLENTYLDDTAFNQLVVVAFPEIKLNIMEYVFGKYRFSYSLLYVCVFSISMEKILSLPDKHFTNMYRDKNFIPEHLVEPFLSFVEG